MRIGSLIWRFFNYGLIASLKYIYIEKVNKSVFEHSQHEIITSLSLLNSRFLRISEKEIIDLENDLNQIHNNICEKLAYLDLNGHSIKKSIMATSVSTTRLKVLVYIIKNFNFNVIIESGTQHGVSSLVMERFVNYVDCSIYSLDIKPNIMPESLGTINYVNLKPRVRQSFKTTTRSFVKLNDKILFFHDSDHSYENMTFEFNWAWNELKIDCLVSDDVSENLAFSNFVKRNNLSPFYCKFDSGPVVGFVIRR
jgi:predicted O-methyltransferase YrrM